MPQNLPSNQQTKNSIQSVVNSGRKLNQPLNAPLPTNPALNSAQPQQSKASASLPKPESPLLKILKKSRISTGSTINPNINERARNNWEPWEVSEEEKKLKARAAELQEKIDIEKQRRLAELEKEAQKKADRIGRRIKLARAASKIALTSIVFTIVLLITIVFLNKDNLPWMQEDNAKAVTPRGYLRSIKKDTISFFTAEQLSSLGVENLPENYQVQAEIKGVKLIKTSTLSFTQRQIKVIELILEKTPEKLLDSGPLAIVVHSPTPSDERIVYDANYPQIFASGNYIFYNDRSFEQEKSIASRSFDEVYRKFIFELTKTAQFNTISKSLDEVALKKELESGKNWVELSTNIPLISEFAVVSGWKINSQTSRYYLDEKEDLTTDLGRTSIQNDMAETIAATLMTEFDLISEGRKAWALKYLSLKESDVLINKLPRNTLTERAKLENVSVDFTEVQKYLDTYDLVDKRTFISEQPEACLQLRNFGSEEAPKRGWEGSFIQQTTRDNVVRYSANFKSKYNRDLYVELQSYENSRIEAPADCVIVIYSAFKFNPDSDVQGVSIGPETQKIYLK